MTDQLNEQQNILKVFGEAFQSFFDNSGKKVNEDDGGGGEAPASVNGVGGVDTIEKPLTTVRRKLDEVELQKRINLPQIRQHEDFIQDLTVNGIVVHKLTVDPNSLEPTQSEFNDDKVQGMIKTGNYKNFPIISSKDQYIVDGHHRWKSAQVANDTVDTLKIDMDYNDLFDFLDGKSYIVNKGINEQKQGM